MVKRAFLYWGFLITVLGAIAMIAGSLAQGPDRDLQLTRQSVSKLDPTQLSAALTDVKSWPLWFNSVQKVTIENSRVHSGLLQKGAIARFVLKSPRETFELTALVSELESGLLKLRLLADSTNRLTTLFDRLDWEIRIEPGDAFGTPIRVTTSAHTAHWKSRLFGGLMPETLMKFVFFPDPKKLASLTTLPH